MKQSHRPSLGRAINAAAGALQQFVQQHQAENAHQRNKCPSQKNVAQDHEDQFDGIVFSGNPHETVPRKLLLDDRLSPLERNCWQVFRLLINTDGVTAFPSYDQLRPYLGSAPAKSASRETIAKALTVLRLTRWLSLGKRVRDSLSGRVQGNVYILHDEPIGCVEAMEIDRDYMLLVGQSLGHANKSVRLVAEHAFNEFASDTDRDLPTRIDVIAERLTHQQTYHGAGQMPEFGIRTQQVIEPSALSSDSELSKKPALEIPNSLSSESELSLNPGVSHPVRIPNSYSTYTNTKDSVFKSFVPHEPTQSGLQLPESLNRLTAGQRQRALVAIDQVNPDIRQAVLNQWHHRVSNGEAKNPFGYLFSCVQMALKGEFNAAWKPPAFEYQHVARPVTESPVPCARANEPQPPNPIPQRLPQTESNLAKGQDVMRNLQALVNSRPSTR
ncbi:hypothetical protein YA0002_17965 [Pseudomonas cichorii]|uniref:STY4528 family pathogenicity island replication protein n=1 Tax=Pseudomonas cichorii TaxID=36746 RepID=UPI0018E5B10D|nr:STY4528 family pathogenicity island replication protein [Pseudomonas cichorii]MBI6854664.1 hypothetical protein [Pseudomonas cichorii]